MNPTTTYYLLLYLLVLVVNFFRVRKQYQIPDENTPNPEKFNWKPILYVSLDMVYTSAGFIILLIQTLQEWVPAIVIFYLILILFSSNLDSISEKFGEGFKLTSHIVIILIIITLTILTFNSNWIGDANNEYKVAIPYKDRSLITKFGYEHFGEQELLFSVKLMAKNRDQAEELGIEAFWKDASANFDSANAELHKKTS